MRFFSDSGTTVRRTSRGVEVEDVRYFASQPWSFPQSLMLGFFARGASKTIIRGEELEEVRWFTREDVRALERAASVSLPGIDTIARRLIATWLRDEHEGVRSGNVTGEREDEQ